MDLEISTGEIRRGIRDYLADHDCLADVRSIADAGQSAPAHPPFDAAVWRGLACDLGTAALTVPEEYGGLGLGLRAATGALFEAGHELYPGPLRSTASATAALAATSARPDALMAIANEGAVASLAVPVADVQGGCGVTLDGALLRGTARAVPHGASATILVVVADASLVLVPRMRTSCSTECPAP
jgi:alkylation response protein AidB-like acyl-CoA dehydrogenase